MKAGTSEVLKIVDSFSCSEDQLGWLGRVRVRVRVREICLPAVNTCENPIGFHKRNETSYTVERLLKDTPEIRTPPY